MLRGNIAATSLKMLLKNLYSVKCYDKLNMNVLTLNLWENFWWGLIYFDQFIIIVYTLYLIDPRSKSAYIHIERYHQGKPHVQISEGVGYRR